MFSYSFLESVISIVHPNQSGFVKGRLVTDYIRLIDDFNKLPYKFNQAGMIVFLDFLNAFDSVEKGSISNFDDYFIKLIKTIINNAESCVHNGGWLFVFL